MKRKRIILISLLSMSSLLFSCSNSNTETENKNIENANVDENNQKQTEVINEEIDYSKDKYTLTWNVNDKETVVKDVVRGTYPEYGEIPTKTSLETNKMYKFVGWSKDNNTNNYALEDELSPVVKDITYNAVFEYVDSYQVEMKTAINYLNPTDYKTINVPANTKLTLTEDDIPVIEDSESNTYQFSSFYDYDKVTEGVKETYTLDNLPIINSNRKIYLNYQSLTKTYKASFYNDDIHYVDKNGAGDVIVPYKKSISEACYPNSNTTLFIARLPDPVKIENGKKYTFLGWNKNKDATTGQQLSELSEILTSDVTYYAIYDSDESSDVALYYYDEDNDVDVAYTYEEALNNYFVINDGVLSFAKQLFNSKKVSNLEIYLPDNSNITSISDGAFNDFNITKIRLPNTLTSLGKGTFENSKLKSIDISDTSITNILERTFNNCTNLERVNGFDKIENVGSNAFSNCNNLYNYDLDNIKTIKDEAFTNFNQDEIDINQSEVGKGAFKNSNLTSVNINNVKTLETNVFRKSEKLTSVNISKNVEEISLLKGGSNNDNAFTSCDNITSLSIDLENKNYYSFNNSIVTKENNNLIYGNKNTIISDKVKSINQNAFYNSNIKKIRIPGSVTSLHYLSFNQCKNLARIDYDGTIKQFKGIINSPTKENLLCDNNVKVHCSDGIYEISSNV